ncbi:hypothetical protein H310_02365 [Aphanomyces invadans]|uniref:Uncharacterized protein n=1 Tax=Aphanomyces invadans TaxID=157072 RepID=A0A024UQU7_9STRA|nr:hypothetical protein H310_02365 [Aphanomyces invadans]ETW07978.1 hypothetical protein H310_02365 [Aphanomyces invadans]|eukprot:XP_008864071.1 hypothetical protein H310_02365 [Aphanomyces invadans]
MPLQRHLSTAVVPIGTLDGSRGTVFDESFAHSGIECVSCALCFHLTPDVHTQHVHSEVTDKDADGGDLSDSEIERCLTYSGCFERRGLDCSHTSLDATSALRAKVEPRPQQSPSQFMLSITLQAHPHPGDHFTCSLLDSAAAGKETTHVEWFRLEATRPHLTSRVGRCHSDKTCLGDIGTPFYCQSRQSWASGLGLQTSHAVVRQGNIASNIQMLQIPAPPRQVDDKIVGELVAVLDVEVLQLRRDSKNALQGRRGELPTAR